MHVSCKTVFWYLYWILKCHAQGTQTFYIYYCYRRYWHTDWSVIRCCVPDTIRSYWDSASGSLRRSENRVTCTNSGVMISRFADFVYVKPEIFLYCLHFPPKIVWEFSGRENLCSFLWSASAMGKLRLFCRSDLKANLLRPKCGLLFEEIC